MAGKYDNSAIETIKSRLDLVEVVRRYVDLRQKGARWWGPCPFHQETQGSFSISPDNRFYYCFGCQASGDVIDFYCKINGLEFKEGLAQLAEETGVNLSTHQPNPQELAAKEFKRACLKMYELAQRHFQENLRAPAGQTAREYLANRKLSPEMIEKFGLGWAMDDWHALEGYLARAGYAKDKALESGLLAQSEKGNVYDRFRERVIFPIMNLSNQVIAFGGRILTSEGPKYINSSDTPIYNKGEHLYGLAQARRAIGQTKQALLTEGYMDVLALHQFGYENGCGVLGTSLTAEQVQRLAGFCSNVDLIFDGDVAGRKAALRSAEMILARGLKCRVLLMPEGEDIDSLLMEHGTDAFEQVRAQARDGLDFAVRTVASEYAPKDVMKWAREFIAKLDAELAAYFIPRVAAGLDVSERELRSLLPAPRQGGHHDGSQGAWQEPRDRFGGRQAHRGPQVAQADSALRQEKQILGFAIRNPEFHQALVEHGAVELLASERARQLWLVIEERNLTGVEPVMDDAQKRFWIQCQLELPHFEEHKQEELGDVIRFLGECRTKRAARQVSEALREARVSGAPGAEEPTDRSKEFELLRALQDTLRRDDE